MELIRHEGDPDRTAVILPGVRYFSQAPLLWFTREAAQAEGFQVLELAERAPGDREPFDWMRERAEQVLAEAGEDPIVIGKSLASAAAPLVVERGLRAIWLTPLLIRSEVVAALKATTRPTLLVGSPADPSWGDGELPAGDALEVLELEGLDHSLQVEGDPLGSIEILRRVTARISAFLASEPSSRASS